MYIAIKSALASIRRKKAQSFLIGIIIVLVSGLLYIGVSMISQSNPFDEMAERANATETLIIMSKEDNSVNELTDWYLARDEVEGLLKYQTDILTCKYNGEEEEKSINLFVTEFHNNVEYDLLFVDGEKITEPPKNDEVLLNYNFAKNQELEVGDKLWIVANNSEVEVTVSALVVDSHFSTPFLSPNRCFVHSDFFTENNIENQMEMISIKYKDISVVDDVELFDEFTIDYDEEIAPIFLDYASIKSTYSIIFSIIAAILIAVSMVIFVIVVFVIRSTIQNLIRQKYKQIGVQKAIGYTSKQIRNSMLMVYLIIGIIACILGTFAALPVRNMINQSISYDMQINIVSGFDVYFVINVILIVAMLTLSTLIATKKATKVKPVQAIKYGREESSSEGTSYSIRGKKASFSLILTIKQMLSNRKRTISMVVLLILLAFGGFLIRNIGTTLATPKHFASNLFGMEIGDFAIQMDENVSLDELIEDIKGIDGVEDIIFSANSLSESFDTKDGSSHSVGGLLVLGNVEDYVIINNGRAAINDNEIVISEYISIDSGKGVGDYLTILNEEGNKKYLITGIYNSISNGGYSYIKKADENEDDLLSSKGYFWGYFEGSEIKIEDVKTDILDIAGDGAKVTKYDNNITFVLSTLESFPLVIMVVLFIFLLVGGIILLNSTIMDINNSVKVYGIMKAMGFSKRFITKMQIIRSLIITIVGVFIGFAVCMLSMNSIMIGVFQMTPFSTISMPVLLDVEGSALIAGLFIFIAVLSPFLATRRLNKISPKQLIAE